MLVSSLLWLLVGYEHLLYRRNVSYLVIDDNLFAKLSKEAFTFFFLNPQTLHDPNNDFYTWLCFLRGAFSGLRRFFF